MKTLILTAAVVLACVLLTRAATGFSASTLQDGGGFFVNPGSSWLTAYWTPPDRTMPSWFFNDGHFVDEYSLYTIPVTGVYTFHANLFLEATEATPLNQNIDLVLVTCPSTGCGTSFLGACNQVTGVIHQGANTWVNDVQVNGATPAFNPAITFTGRFTAGTTVGLCVENWSGTRLTSYLAQFGISNFSGLLIST